jgi:hypothetical protein
VEQGYGHSIAESCQQLLGCGVGGCELWRMDVPPLLGGVPPTTFVVPMLAPMFE